MKSIYFLLIYLCLFNLATSAQCLYDPSNTTHPDSIPCAAGDQIGAGCNWDWRQQDYSMYFTNEISQVIGPINRFSPYFTPGNANIDHFDNQWPVVAKDMHPEDGWELIKRRFGQPYDNASLALPNPWIIFYNKYTSTLRVFIMLTQKDDSYNGASIEIRFLSGINKESALLSHHVQVCKALDQFDKKVAMSVPNEFHDALPHWLYADFTVAYDPCTCTELTYFEIQPSYIKTGNINLTIQGTISESPVVNGAVSSSSVAGSNTSFSLDNISSAVKSGEKFYKSTEEAVNTIKNLLEKQDTAMQKKKFKNLAAYNRWRKQTNYEIDLDSLTSHSDGSYTGTVGKNGIRKILALPSWLYDGVPYLGAVVGVLDLFIGGGKDNTPPKPAIHYVNLTATGTLTFESNGTPISLSVPGSDNTGSSGSVPPHKVPEYNQVLGVFNLLETPELEYVEYQGTGFPVQYKLTYDPATGTNIFKPHYIQNQPKVRQYRLKEDLKYAVNPASRLVVEDIQAALLFQPQSRIGNAAPIKYFLLNKLLGPVELGKVDLDQPYKERMDNAGYELENWPSNQPNNKHAIMHRTRYVPLGCLTQQSILLHHQSNSSAEPIIYCKLIVTLRRPDAGPNTPPVVMVLTYEVTTTAVGGGTGNYYQITTIPELMDEEPGIDPETQLPIDDPAPSLFHNFHLTGFTSAANPGGLHWPAPFYGIPNTLVFEDTLLTTNQTAFEDIYIGSNVLIAPGTVIRAGQYIEINPINQYDPDVLFEIGHLTSCELQEVPAQTPEEISTFCSNQYHPEVSKRSINPPAPDKPDPAFRWALQPNPAGNQVSVLAHFVKDRQVTITLRDLTGKEVKLLKRNHAQTQGDYRESFNINDLAPGIYLLELQADDYREAKKLVVVR